MFAFFGGRKKSPEREDSTEENQPSDPAASGNDFVFIERRQDVPNYGNPGVYPALPYPVAPSTDRQPERPMSSNTTVVSQNYLSGVPFKLSSKAEYDVDSFVGADLSKTIYLARNMNLADFEYEFKVEKSVLREGGQESF